MKKQAAAKKYVSIKIHDSCCVQVHNTLLMMKVFSPLSLFLFLVQKREMSGNWSIWVCVLVAWMDWEDTSLLRDGEVLRVVFLCEWCRVWIFIKTFRDDKVENSSLLWGKFFRYFVKFMRLLLKDKQKNKSFPYKWPSLYCFRWVKKNCFVYVWGNKLIFFYKSIEQRRQLQIFSQFQ